MQAWRSRLARRVARYHVLDDRHHGVQAIVFINLRKYMPESVEQQPTFVVLPLEQGELSEILWPNLLARYRNHPQHRDPVYQAVNLLVRAHREQQELVWRDKLENQPVPCGYSSRPNARTCTLQSFDTQPWGHGITT